MSGPSNLVNDQTEAELNAAADLVRLYDEKWALIRDMSISERPTGAMADAVLAKDRELDAACEAFRRRFYPRKHHVIVGLRAVMACSRTRRSVNTLYDAGPIAVGEAVTPCP